MLKLRSLGWIEIVFWEQWVKVMAGSSFTFCLLLYSTDTQLSTQEGVCAVDHCCE